MAIELRGLDLDDWDTLYDGLDLAFGGLPEVAEERAFRRRLTDPGQSFVLWDGTLAVGTLGTFGLGLSVPGGAVVPAAGVTQVHVAATHRRRGLLRRMMGRALERYRELGVPLAVLTASEAGIYGRFGYGVAAHGLHARIEVHRVSVQAPPGTDGITLRRAEPAAALARCEELYARLVPTRPGMLERRPGWEDLPLLDPPQERRGASARQWVLAERDGELLGYARYATRRSWEAGLPEGTVIGGDLDAVAPTAYAALLRYLAGIDLMSTLVLPSRPVDDPLVHLLSDVRRARLRVEDRLHLRPVDVGAALAARGYLSEVDTVLAVEDAFCPWNTGRWRLSGAAAGAVCERTGDAAELALDVRALSAAYLGGTTLASLAGAGLVTEVRPGALAALSPAFAGRIAPWLPHGF